MAAEKWSDIVRRCDRLGLSRAEMARLSGISESTVVKGLKRDSRLRGVTRRAVLATLDEYEQGEAA